MSKILLAAIIGIVIGLIAGHFITTKFLSEPIPKGYVRVTVNNQSGHVIKLLTLKHQSGSIEMEGLAKQEKVNLIFKNGGENSYRIKAILDDNSTVSSNGEYVEAGYRTVETVFADSIKIDRNAY
jgi:flagellar hook assembly protein FlgD